MVGNEEIQQIAIRSLRPDDENDWRQLWSDYLSFYRARLPTDVADATWARLIGMDDKMHAIGATVQGKLIGFAHHLNQATTWSLQPSCYLHDLFVAVDARGRGAARALINEVATRATVAGCDRLHWLTQEYNADARALYDTLATRTSFVQYVKRL